LLAKPKMTAVFCESLILKSSLLSVALLVLGFS
jgi:hypothetical protein